MLLKGSETLEEAVWLLLIPPFPWLSMFSGCPRGPPCSHKEPGTKGDWEG